MPAPTIPAGRPGAQPGEEEAWEEPNFGHAVRSIELEMPEGRGGEVEKQLENLRRKFEFDMAHVLERLQAVEGRLGLEHRPLPAATDSNINNQVQPVIVEASAPDEGNEKKLVKLESIEDDGSTDVYFEESAWSIPVLAAINDLDIGRFDRLFGAVLVILNFGMQAAFSWVLLTDAFIGEAFESRVETAKIWRTSVAHDYKYMDLARTSLVSRVCTGDGALILSTTQATLIHQIDSFLGLAKGQFEHSVFQPGVLLSMICILLWTLCVYKEFRRIWLQLEAAATIPRARRTVFRNNRFVSMSFGRLSLLLGTYLARTIIASVLLVAGILWLARTTSIEELMLNAVALNAILDVDEFLFSGMTPIKIQHAVQKLRPIKVKYGRLRSQVESVVHFVSLTLLIFLAYYALLLPLSDTMLAVKNELCGGNQTFVVSYNSQTQQTIALKTELTRSYANLSVSEVAVQNHKGTSFETTPGNVPSYLSFSSTPDLFQADLSRTMAEEAAITPFCIESFTMPGSPLAGDESLQMLAAQRVTVAALTVGREDAQSCQEMGDLCYDFKNRLLRLTCGFTCGCTDPFSSPWYKTEAQGCATACLNAGNMVLQRASCEDRPMDENWESFWTVYPDVISGFYGRDVRGTSFFADMNTTLQAMLVGGCAALSQHPNDPLTGASWCQGNPQLFRPIATLCPRSCGCAEASGDLPSYCPVSCMRRSTNSSFGGSANSAGSR